jgi:hypothetical protein
MCFKINMIARIRGISVKRGARETFMPFVIPPRMVSEIMSAMSGPGDRPAVIPRDNPIPRYSNAIVS